MTHQDYITRKRSPNKKSNPYKKSSDNHEASAPLKIKIIGIATLLSVAAFAYGLWVLKDSPAEEVIEVSAEIEEVKPTKEATTDKTTLPAPPKEKWTYVDGLKTKEVETGEYEVSDSGPYKMQCGSFRTKEQAEVLKANIAFAGLSAQLSQSSGQNGLYYKVFLGPYPRKRLAEKDKHLLKNNNINHCQIWLWN